MQEIKETRSSKPRDWTQVSCTAGGFFNHLGHQGSPKILEWVAYPFSRGSFQPRDWTQVSCIAGRFFTSWATREAGINKLINTSEETLVVKNPPGNAGDGTDESLISRLGRSPGGAHGNPHQHSCPENTLDRGAWWATVHRVTKSWTRLKRLSTQAYIHNTCIHMAFSILLGTK